MSDISKKVFSIEPDIKDVIKNIEPMAPDTPIGNSSDKIESASKPTIDEPIMRPVDPDFDKEPVPNFITKPASSPVFTEELMDAPSTAWMTWLGSLLILIWLALAGFYYYSQFGPNLPKEPQTVTFLIVSGLLPVILITLLFTALKRLSQINYRSQAIVKAVENIAQKEIKSQPRTELTKALATQVQSDLSQIEKQMASLAKHRSSLETMLQKFESRMSGISDDFKQRSETLSQNITNITGSSKSIGSELENAATTLTASQNQLTRMNTQLSEMISRLQEEQTKLQTEMQTQVKELTATSETSIVNSQQLMEALRQGQDSVAALNSASMKTNDVLSKQFEDMGNKIVETQIKATEVSDKAATRVQQSLAETRRDLSKLETDILALKAKLKNAAPNNAQLDLTSTSSSEQNGIGRLNLKPLDTDFPPVEPPRLISNRAAKTTQEMFEPLDEVVKFDDNLHHTGADLSLHNPDDEITHYNPEALSNLDILRRPTETDRKEDRGNWRWRDMLGGITRSDTAESATDIVDTTQNKSSLAPVDNSEIVATLCEYDLAPSAVLDEGTIIEAANAYANAGGIAMQGLVRDRLAAPAAHLRQKLTTNNNMNQKFRQFTDQYLTKLSRTPQDASHLRADFGTAQGRAFLICVAAFG